MRAQLTQEELAQAAGISTRAVSDLERGINRTAHKDTARLLARALGMDGPSGELFVAAARGRVQASEVLSAGQDADWGRFAAAASRSLPRDIASFTGRQAELAQLLDETDVPAAAGVIGIYVIDGMAGIGKTTLAVHAAHQLAGRFPDGQFFLRLHGHTSGQKPVDPADALVSVLLTAGMTVQQIPPDLEARAARWRDLVAGKKVLLLLDDAASHEQIAPLLPGDGGSLVLITSRRRLTAVQDAAVISLNTLRPDEGAALLARLAGRSEIKPQSAAAEELARLCTYLPLAIGMLASQLRHHPAWTADKLADDLAQARDRLALMRAENVSVAAAFDLSYQDLSPERQRLFRRLGLVPGPTVDAYAAAALDNTSPDETNRGLAELYDLHLLTEPALGRYQLHDLLREYAHALAAIDDPEESSADLGRLLDYYLHTAAAADRLIARRPSSSTAPMARAPSAVPQLATRHDADAWLSDERADLAAATRHAAASGRPVHAVWIPAHLAGFLATHGYWDQALSMHLAAAGIAETAGDQAGHATALQNLGLTYLLIGDYPAAIKAHKTAHGLYRDLGKEIPQIDILNVLGRAYTAIDDSAQATASAAEALSRACTARDRLGQADALRVLGSNAHSAADYPTAMARLAEGVGLYREIGDQMGLAFTLAELALVQQNMGDYKQAERSLTETLTLYCALKEHRYEGEALARLGCVYRLTGDYQAAAAALNRALDTLRDLNAPHPKLQALSELGALQHLTGKHRAAAASLAHALRLAREVGDRQGQAYALNHLGAVEAGILGPADGLARHREALAIAREITYPLEEADALAGIGRCHIQAGDTATGLICLRQSIGIYQRIGSPAAREVQRILSEPAI
jgi:tetratricopeptide (TPR) repeat protein/transcriptional regulator with XRE-family HTH domain